MARLILIFFLALALPTTSMAAFGAPSCQSHCPDDDDAGQCPTGCTDCACCPAARVLTSLSVEIAPLASATHASEPSALRPRPVDPREIAHVPKG